MLGSEGGRHVHVAAGDLLVLPAGTGHCRIKASNDFLLVGAFPQGQDWDICREAPDEATLARIAAVPLPPADPIEGEGGALMRHWSARS